MIEAAHVDNNLLRQLTPITFLIEISVTHWFDLFSLICYNGFNAYSSWSRFFCSVTLVTLWRKKVHFDGVMNFCFSSIQLAYNVNCMYVRKGLLVKLGDRADLVNRSVISSDVHLAANNWIDINFFFLQRCRLVTFELPHTCEVLRFSVMLTEVARTFWEVPRSVNIKYALSLFHFHRSCQWTN